MSQKKNRALFEEAVGTPNEQNASIKPVSRDDEKLANRRAIALWQFVLAGLVVLMIAVGGLTRLTDSGLSITEWNLVTGILPPFTEAGWLAEFEKYKLIPEYTEMNFNMSLAEFKPIYWWEWGHRFLGRIVGLAFLIPFVLFIFRKRIPTGWTMRLLIPGVLIAVQGAIGWWMVTSGLTERVDVAPYRLATHLGVAFLIFALLIWNGLSLSRPEHVLLKERRQRIVSMMSLSGAVLAFAFIQVLSGALVAGLDAGRGYTDWPLMNGALLPPEAIEMMPFWHNIFENPALAQFNHRVLGYLLFASVVFLWWRSRRAGHNRVKRWADWVLVAAVGQTLWGILTVLNGAPWNYAIFHQLGAVLLIFLLLRTRFEAAYPTEQKIERGA